MANTRDVDHAGDIAIAEKALIAARDTHAAKLAHLDALTPDSDDAQTYAAAEADVRHANRILDRAEQLLASAHAAARLAHLTEAKARFLAALSPDEEWEASEARLREAQKAHTALQERHNDALAEIARIQSAAGIKAQRPNIPQHVGTEPSEETARMAHGYRITGEAYVIVDGVEHRRVSVKTDPGNWRNRSRAAR